MYEDIQGCYPKNTTKFKEATGLDLIEISLI